MRIRLIFRNESIFGSCAAALSEAGRSLRLDQQPFHRSSESLVRSSPSTSSSQGRGSEISSPWSGYSQAPSTPFGAPAVSSTPFAQAADRGQAAQLYNKLRSRGTSIQEVLDLVYEYRDNPRALDLRNVGEALQG